MKIYYKIAFAIILSIHISFIVTILFLLKDNTTILTSLIQVTGIFIPAYVSIIALHLADPMKRVINVKLEVPHIKEKECQTYSKSLLYVGFNDHFKNIPSPIKTYKVYFHLTNISGFVLNNPVVTFKIPLDKQGPRLMGDLIAGLHFNSKLKKNMDYYSEIESGDEIYISKKILNYWNHKDTFKIWFEMFLKDLKTNKFEPFFIYIYINSDNADGKTLKVYLDPIHFVARCLWV